jgi:hypothetical protein
MGAIPEMFNCNTECCTGRNVRLRSALKVARELSSVSDLIDHHVSLQASVFNRSHVFTNSLFLFVGRDPRIDEFVMRCTNDVDVSLS